MRKGICKNAVMKTNSKEKDRGQSMAAMWLKSEINRITRKA